MNIYRIENVVNDDGDLAGDILRTSVTGAMVKYADEYGFTGIDFREDQ